MFANCHCSYGHAGAVWDIARREDVPDINSWLKGNCSEFKHQGLPVEDSPNLNPVLDQKFMLVERHREALKRETGVEFWHFEQHLGEGVLIPGGCPHQVRNLKSCCKVGRGGGKRWGSGRLGG